MRYDDPELQDRLAGEYALGALRGPARRRLEALMRTRPELQDRVGAWQQDLTPLDEETPAVEPPLRILERLMGSLDSAHSRPKLPFWARLGFWRPFGVAAAALTVLLAVSTLYLASRPPDVEDRVQVFGAPSYVAVLQSDAEIPAVVVTAFKDPFRLVVEPTESLAIPADGTLRLWAVERDSGTVRPLTTIAGGAAFLEPLSDEGWQHIKTAESLIVSLEPLGAAAEAPVGPILYSGPCLNLKGPPET